ncbi:MAG TPA: hypothetical protein VN155_16885 [Devosia sp.]|nr:hypothetical protein [Devosia sp.]
MIRTIPHTRRRGSFDGRPILWATAGGAAAWLVVYIAYRVLGFAADAAAGALMIAGGF